MKTYLIIVLIDIVILIIENSLLKKIKNENHDANY